MKSAHNVAVLMYHHVARDAGSLTVSAQQFESQIRGLAEKGYQSMRADEFAAFCRGEPVPRKSVLITFDDGHLDNWVYAHPVLKRDGMSAVLFAITGLIGEGPARPYQGQGRPLPVCLPHDQAKVQMFSADSDAVMLRWDEIQAMVDAGTFEIHSHTHTHIRWDRKCASATEKAERIRYDLDASRRTLIEKLGSASSHLCWPQGYFDDDYKQAAAEHGFTHLYTTDARGQNVPNGDISHIYRFAVRNRSFT